MVLLLCVRDIVIDNSFWKLPWFLYEKGDIQLFIYFFKELVPPASLVAAKGGQLKLGQQCGMSSTPLHPNAMCMFKCGASIHILKESKQSRAVSNTFHIAAE